MNCHEFEADIVDLARSGSALAGCDDLRAHLAGCTGCAGRYRRERTLSDGLRALAGEAEAVPDNPATERRLMAAFASRAALGGAVTSTRPGVGRWVLAAAASLVLVASGWSAVRWQRDRSASSPAAGRQAATVARAAAETPETSRPAPALPAAAPVRPAPAAASAARPGRVARPQPPARPPATASRDAVAVDDAEDFVMLPAAERLPRFESGMIVRVELPITSLPAYGLPILPDAGRTPVAADVLVGQDGQPRAIRLVNRQTGPRRRQ